MGINKQIIAQKLKQSLHTVAEDITDENLVDRILLAKMTIDWAELLLNGHPIDEPTNNENTLDVRPTTANDQIDNDIILDIGDDAADISQMLLTVVEKSIGYSLVDSNDVIHESIREGFARKLGLAHGQLVRLSPKEVTDPNSYEYFVTIISEGTESPYERIPNMTLINESQAIIVDAEERIVWDIPQPTITAFKLQEGDVFEAKQRIGMPETRVVTWVYPMDFPTVERTKKSNKTQQKPKIEKANKNESTTIEGIDGQSILLVGMDIKADEIKPIVEQSGGTLLTVNQQSIRQSRMKSLVKQADIVIMAKSYVSHSQTKLAIKFAKMYNIPFASFDGFSTGDGGFIGALTNALSKR